MPHNAVAFEVQDIGYGDKAVPGAYQFVEFRDAPGVKAGIIHACPCGCGLICSLWFRGLGRGHAEWDVQGQWPKVSLTPSIGIKGMNKEGFHWHGYLTDGEFREC